MQEVIDLISEAVGRRPRMQAQDAVKLLYQRCFGPGHLIAEPEQARARLLEEWDACQDVSLPLLETLGNGLCRVNLAPSRALGLRPDTLCALFLRCAGSAVRRTAEFYDALECVRAFSFSESDADAYVNAYLVNGCPQVRHSGQYRDAYHPAYRVAWERDARYLPLLAWLDQRLPGASPQKPLFLSIDGPAASGKSTLAALLEELYGALVLHMDDYFLPPERKTAERLAQPGGNVDWERFLSEALTPLRAGAAAALRRYDCRSGLLLPPQPQNPRPLIVVEGAYSLHPALRSQGGGRVFLTVDPVEQACRILQRNGEAMAERFSSEWIPLENAYFRACGVQAICDFVF